MSRLYRKKGLLIVVVLLALLSSCALLGKKDAPKGKNIICIVDFSDSKNTQQRLHFYMNVIKDTVIPKLGRYDKITVIPLDQASITNSTDILFNDFSLNDFEPEIASPIEVDKLTTEKLNQYKMSVSNEFVQNFQKAIDSRNSSSHETDIFGALGVVKGKLRSAGGNYIILFSDMMNWSSALNMEPQNKNFNNATIDKILQSVPNYEMPNTTALVLTAEQVEATPAHFKLVQSFWTKYFEKNKIKLYDYNSASLSKLNELLAQQAGK